MAELGTQRGRRPLRVGLCLPIDAAVLPTAPARGPDLTAMAGQAAGLGCGSLWLPDHLLVRFPDRPATGQWACWPILAGLAVATRRSALATLVTATSVRNPALLAKMAAAVDEISGRRLPGALRRP